MVQKTTISGCTEEIERLLRLLLYSKCDKSDEEEIKTQLKYVLGQKAKLEQEKAEQKERVRADKEYRRLGLQSWSNTCRDKGVM